MIGVMAKLNNNNYYRNVRCYIYINEDSGKLNNKMNH